MVARYHDDHTDYQTLEHMSSISITRFAESRMVGLGVCCTRYVDERFGFVFSTLSTISAHLW